MAEFFPLGGRDGIPLMEKRNAYCLGGFLRVVEDRRRPRH